MQGYKYDVFLSFRGPDVRSGFASFVYHCLEDAGVHAFWKEDEIIDSVEIRMKVLGAIEQSKISIPIFSPTYASSRWCLEELAQMVECRRKRRGHIILPIFFYVDPSEVRSQTGRYGEDLGCHQERRGMDNETIDKWRDALREVGGLGGWNVEKASSVQIIREVVAKVLMILKRNFVGIEQHVKEVMDLLNVESSDVRVVGIHGIGGTGKTTIAKLVYRRILHLFDACSFLESVRENAKKPQGLVNLQGQLISDLLGAINRQIPPDEDVIKSISSRFFHKKVLIVLDDIDQSFGLAQILGSREWLGSGSRIIITTRKKEALDELEDSQIYDVGGMQLEEALELFHDRAFRGEPVPDDYFASLSRKIVSTVDLLPLTIEVVGSYLFSKSKDEWKQTLDELENVPDKQQNLKVIVEKFPDKHRQIFLDIACFFIGEDKNVACYLWSDCDYPASEAELTVLLDSSIVKIESGKLWMHDLLQDLGRNIVDQEHREPGKCSRLWIQEKALDVLKNEKGTQSIQGVLLKFNSGEQCSFRPEHFASMSNIKFLRLDQADLDGKFESSLSSLRWLHWQGCPRIIRAENLDLKKLVILDLSWSKVNEKWKGWRYIEKTEKLKVLNLTGCHDLIRTPDLSHYKNLERLILKRCIRLVEIDSSVKSLKSLVSLDLRFCAELNKLPEELGSLISLEEIFMDGTAVQEIPASIGHLQKLKRFSACNCLSLIQLPKSFSHVKSLEVLALNDTKITQLPPTGELKVLQHLSISRCRLILKLPTSLGTLASLIELDLSSTAIVELPNDINSLILLKVLKIDFTFVRELPSAIWKLKRLEELHASRCRSLDGEIPSNIKDLLELRILRLGYSQIRGLPDSISTLPNLQMLDLLHCDELQEVPKLPSTLISLSVSSKLMDTIPYIHHLVKLGDLFLADGSPELEPVKGQMEAKGSTCLQLESLSELKTLKLSLLKIQLLPFKLDHLRKLTKLSLCCIHLKKLPQLPPGLFTLSLRQYKLLTGLPDLSYLELLSEFELFQCAVTKVPGLGKFQSLRVLRISHCDLEEMNGLENLISLAALNVSYCRSLKRLPNLSRLKQLKDIKIKGCPEVSVIRSVEHLNSCEKLSSSKTEAGSSSEMETSKTVHTEHSATGVVKCEDKAVFPTDVTPPVKDDGNSLPVNDEDNDGYNIPEGENEHDKSISLAISDKPSLPPIAEAKFSKSDKSFTEAVGASSYVQSFPSQSSPSVGDSSITRGRVKENLSDVEPDKYSSVPVDLTGTKTTGISLSTDQDNMPLSIIPSLATIGSAVPPQAARVKSLSATDNDKVPIVVEADLCGEREESLFLKIESLLSGDSAKQTTGIEMSQASDFDLQAYHNALQEVKDIMSLGLLEITYNRKLLGRLQKSLNFLVRHNMPEVSTIGHQCVYLKLQNFIKSVGDSLSSQQKIFIECERFERELKKEKSLLASDKDEVVSLMKQSEEKAKSVADNEQIIAKLQAEIEAHKRTVENAKSQLSSLSTKISEKFKELENKYEQVLSMESDNLSMEKKRNQAQETIDKINVEWNELHADIKGPLASK